MSTKRLKIKSTVMLPTQSLNFVRTAILPLPECEGARTKALALIIEHWLDHFGKEIPEVPPREREGNDELQRVDLTLDPEDMFRLDLIISRRDDRRFKLTRSVLVDHFIQLTREAVEEERQESAWAGEE